MAPASQRLRLRPIIPLMVLRDLPQGTWASIVVVMRIVYTVVLLVFYEQKPLDRVSQSGQCIFGGNNAILLQNQSNYQEIWELMKWNDKS